VYNVRLIASNDFCLDTAFVNITVSESAIYAPNVFTPNGDGKNDEFRVAFKSIIQFECWIYNRWGRKMYSWTNPLKGWDGTYNGKKMPEGPYFYVIRAVGSDKVVHKLKGSVSLLRGRDN
jgi:gliding motility-associated-like protein